VLKEEPSCNSFSLSVRSGIPVQVVRLLALAVAGLTASGCSSGEEPSVAPADARSPSVFVAQTIDFAHFCSWPSAPATIAADASDGVHIGAGPLTIYWNESPPHGAREFPVGTIVLKESNETDPTERVVFAMIKRQARGTGYNPGGADGWEWMSLKDLGNCNVERLWRGVTPPQGESYATTGDCNTCHALGVANDYVRDEALQLSKF
jgi:hypothetical protein